MKFTIIDNKQLNEGNYNQTTTDIDSFLDDEEFDEYVDRVLDEFITNLTYDSLHKIMTVVGGHIGEEPSSYSPQFIDKYGDVISVDVALKKEETTHDDYAQEILKTYLIWEGIIEEDEDVPTDVETVIVEQGSDLLNKMLKLGIARINPGTSSVEKRFYCVLPDKRDFILNGSQLDTLKKFFELRQGNVIVFLGDYPYRYFIKNGKTSSSSDVTPDSLIHEVSMYYSGINIPITEELDAGDFKDYADNIAYIVSKGMRKRGFSNVYGGVGIDKSEDNDNEYFITVYIKDGDIESFRKETEEVFKESNIDAEFSETIDDGIVFKATVPQFQSPDRATLEKDALEWLEEKGKTTGFVERGFILPNGEIVSNKAILGINKNRPHQDVDETLVSYLALKYKTTPRYVEDLFGLNGYVLVCDRIGCIRINGYNEDYISLPYKMPTNAQFYALSDWIDDFFEEKVTGSLEVTTFDGEQQVTYYTPKYDGEEICKKIKRYYSTGTLYESNKQTMRFKITEDGRSYSDARIDLEEKIESMSYDDIIDLIKQVGGQVSSVQKGSPQFIDRDGGIFDVATALKGKKSFRYLVHREYAEALVERLIKSTSDFDHFSVKDKLTLSLQCSEEMMLQMNNVGIIRINPGTNAVERRCYCVLPNRDDIQLTTEQYDALEEFFELGESIGKNKVEILIEYPSNASFEAYFDTYEPKEIVKRVKRYYTRGSFIFEKKIREALVLHWGDLDKGVKADRREIMGGRGTGHFGTGFYFVSKDKYGDMHYDYNKNRPIYELDTSKYNLFKPRNNDEAYKLHDALKDINRYAKAQKDDMRYKRLELERELDDAIYHVDYDDDDNKLELSDEEWEERYRKNVSSFILKYGKEHFTEEDLKNAPLGRLEGWAKDLIDNIVEGDTRLHDAIFELSLILGKYSDKGMYEIYDIIIDAYKSGGEDSISTKVMKAFGYEGVDVSHLNKDAQGLQGLDNFTYGTVIYDLKPNTYRKIAEPRGKK